MEGSRAFRTLEEQVDRLQRSRDGLHDTKQYLKTDFKVHMGEQSPTSDHCLSYALSDATYKDLQTVCDHQHDTRCARCIGVETVLTDILQETCKLVCENKDATLFEIEKAVDDIRDMKTHLVRSKNQERARTQYASDMGATDVLVTCDWAMKFLPRKYREGQIDWFAKRGINWHFSVVLHKQNSKYRTLTFVHIFKSQVAQDSCVTAAILSDVARDLSNQMPELTNIHLFSDNAGCYKASSTLAAIKSNIGNYVRTYNFSEAQNGKGPCDRNASHAKRCIMRYLNEGHDVTTAEDMKKAIDTFQTGTFRVSVVDAISLESAEKPAFSIPGITAFHNFRFEDEDLRMWKALGIGEGKLLLWKNLPTRRTIHLETIEVMTPVRFQNFIDDEETSQRQKTPKATHFCEHEGCVKEFYNVQSLEQHYVAGQCELRPENMCLTDRVKVAYSDKLNLSVSYSVTLESGFQEVNAEQQQDTPHMGWALKGKKKKTVFSAKQQDFMRHKFSLGKNGGKKVDPFQAAEELRNSKKFERKDFLTGHQIASYFSRLAQKEKHIDPADYVAATDAKAKHAIQLKVTSILT